MSHFFTVPINENGIILDEHIQTNLSSAMAAPFDFSDVFIYSHGWWTNATRAMSEYNQFSIEFAKLVQSLGRGDVATRAKLPASFLGIGIHWPSMLSEDDRAITTFLEAATFFTMEKRADTVGEHGGYSLIRLVLEGRRGTPAPLRIHFLGHSFGCKVVCRALQEIVTDSATVPIPPTVSLNAVLLQAAFDNNDLEAGDVYGGIAGGLPNLRVLVTRSDADKALQEAYPKAQRADFFKSGGPSVALGAQGPTQIVIDQFGGRDSVSVGPGFNRASVAGSTRRLVVADLTPLHQTSTAPVDPFSGHHSDIFHPEIYQLLTGFLFKV